MESALERALKANDEGKPAVLDFVVDSEDVHDTFREFHRDMRGVPEK